MEKFIAFFEIPAADFHRAVGFYETVLDIKLAVSEHEEEKMACFMEQGEAVGAVSWAPDFLPSERGTLIHFYCEEIGKSLERVLQKGGKVIIPETKIDAEGRGHFAVLPIAKETISVCIRINSRCE